MIVLLLLLPGSIPLIFLGIIRLILSYVDPNDIVIKSVENLLFIVLNYISIGELYSFVIVLVLLFYGVYLFIKKQQNPDLQYVDLVRMPFSKAYHKYFKIPN